MSLSTHSRSARNSSPARDPAEPGGAPRRSRSRAGVRRPHASTAAPLPPCRRRTRRRGRGGRVRRVLPVGPHRVLRHRRRAGDHRSLASAGRGRRPYVPDQARHHDHAGAAAPAVAADTADHEPGPAERRAGDLRRRDRLTCLRRLRHLPRAGRGPGPCRHARRGLCRAGRALERRAVQLRGRALHRGPGAVHPGTGPAAAGADLGGRGPARHPADRPGGAMGRRRPHPVRGAVADPAVGAGHRRRAGTGGHRARHGGRLRPRGLGRGGARARGGARPGRALPGGRRDLVDRDRQARARAGGKGSPRGWAPGFWGERSPE